MTDESEGVWYAALMGQIRATIPVFTWRDWGKLRNTSGSLAALPVEIRTYHRLNINLDLDHLSNLLSTIGPFLLLTYSLMELSPS
jgi:hypothetical protein